MTKKKYTTWTQNTCRIWSTVKTLKYLDYNNLFNHVLFNVAFCLALLWWLVQPPAKEKKVVGEKACVCVRVRACVCVCVCKTERERESMSRRRTVQWDRGTLKSILPINFCLLPRRRDFRHGSGIRAPTSTCDYWSRLLSKNLKGIKRIFTQSTSQLYR